MAKREAVRGRQPKLQPCVFGVLCSRHGFIHGAEAEELREKIERVIGTAERDEDSLGWLIRNVLEEVDARDSLAWCEHRAREEGRLAAQSKRAARAQQKGAERR